MTDSPSSSHHSGDQDSAQAPVIRHYLDILRRRIWIIVTVTVVFSCVGAVRAFRAPDIYSSTTSIMIERQSPRIVSFDPSSPDFTWDPDFYNTQSQLILSQAVMEMAVQDPLVARTLGQFSEEVAPPLSDRMKEVILAALGAPPAQTPKLWKRLAGLVSAKPKGGTHFINISATALDPKTPAILVDGVARAFEAYMLKARTELLGDAFSYLKDEKEREEEKYLAAEAELQRFRSESRNIELGNESSPATDKLGAINSRLTDLQLQRAELKAQLVAIPKILQASNTPLEEFYGQILAIPVIKEDTTIHALRAQIEQTESEVQRLSRIYGAEHPLLQDSRTTLSRLREEFNVGIQNTLLLHQNRLEGIEAEEAELSREYDILQEDVLANAQGAFRMARLEMEVDRHRQLYDALVKRMLEVESSAGFETTSIRRFEEATVNYTPIGPNRRLDIILAILMGLGLGLGLAIVIETMDDTIKTPEDLRDKLDIPLLGFVPRIQAKTPDKKHQRIKTLFAVDEPVSSVAEAFRQIRTNIFYSLATESAKVLVSTSCHPGEGKTTTICNLAAVIAQNGRKVLLIDGDFHRPNVHHVYGIKSSVGLVDVLGGSIHWKKALCTPSRNGRLLENIHVIPAGASTAASSERLGSAAMKAFITEAREEYDWVLVDSPPLLFVSDASVLSAMCDGIVLVVKAGMNNRSLLVRTCNQLRQLKVDILGTILNQMVVSFVGRHYSYYYYHGYSHYAENYHKSYYGDSPEEEPVQEEPTPTPPADTVMPAAALLPPPSEEAIPRSSRNGTPQSRSVSKSGKIRHSPSDKKRTAEIQAALTQASHVTDQPLSYHIGAGDILEISLPALRETDQRAAIRRAVDKQGQLAIPSFDPIAATGKTCEEVAALLSELCRDRSPKDSVVTLKVVEHQKAAVLVLGGVVKPGLYPLSSDSPSILEILLQAGGLSTRAGTSLFLTRASDGHAKDSMSITCKSIAMADLCNVKKHEDIIRVSSGDMITVHLTDDSGVHVLGSVQKPGFVKSPPGAPITACTALANAGGFATQDRTEPCRIVRTLDNLTRTVTDVPFSKIIYGELPDISLMTGDVLLVGTKLISKLIPESTPSDAVLSD